MKNTPQRGHIAILAAGFIKWTGGLDFLRLCICGIDSAMPGVTWPVLLPDDSLSDRALDFAIATKRRLFSLAGVKPGFLPPVSTSQLLDVMETTSCSISIRQYYGSPRGLAHVMRSLAARVVLPVDVSLGPRFPYPWVGYIPDLQSKRLPGNFPRHARWMQDRRYRALLADAPAIIVNSKSVIREIEEYYPHPKAALYSLPFCPPACPAGLDDVGDEVLRPYALPEKYFIISNQFWLHKSHETAFEALRLLRDAGVDDAHIVCTGNPHDYRRPGYVEGLRERIAANALTDRIHFLGVIPKMHQLAVMRRSVAVVQPTLFEGGPGGGALYDGVSTGTPVILSDIDVNREADLGAIEFFRAGSADDLAQKMMAMLSNPPQRLSVEETNAMLLQRRTEMGEMLLRVISAVSPGQATKTPIAQER